MDITFVDVFWGVFRTLLAIAICFGAYKIGMRSKGRRAINMEADFMLNPPHSSDSSSSSDNGGNYGSDSNYGGGGYY
ncbi:MAG: hypothetical protein FWC89_07035 [Defluviitaleaceae bacterium]|nr:hypothetical protein [Defluviitaleaceae bacterium]